MQTSHIKLQKYWKTTRKLTKPLLTWLYGFSYKMAPEIEGNYLVLANHNGNLDPWLCGLSFEKQMYFLAGENAFRLGFLSWLVRKLWSPISKQKGTSDVRAMMDLLRHLKEGHNVSLFPEGNRSYNGVTGEILPAIGKLVKKSGAALVTYRFKGMYFCTPRWGKILRRGKTSGSVINVYTKKQLEFMSVEEVYNHILEDLYEDAYATQKNNPVRFSSKTRAEGIESALFLCPQCKAIGSIHSKRQFFWCNKCGSRSEYNEYGYLEGDFLFNTILEWDTWQETALCSYIDLQLKNGSKAPLLSDKDLQLSIIDSNHKEHRICNGELCLFEDRITVGSIEFLFSSIDDFALVFRRTLLFNTTNGEHYQVVSKDFACAKKYISAYTYLISKT